MTRRDWWLGIVVLAAAILVHALVPRYEWRQGPVVGTLTRTDHWTGHADVMGVEGGRYYPVASITRPSP